MSPASSCPPAAGKSPPARKAVAPPLSADAPPLSELTALSPVDGRYAAHSACLRGVFSEFGLFRYRVRVEIAWLKALAACPEMPQLAAFSATQCAFLDGIVRDFSPAEAGAVKEIEQTTRHDLKAVEYYLRRRLAEHPELGAAREFVHFACTSEDINNPAWGLMLRDGLQQVLAPAMAELIGVLEEHARNWAQVPMLARTHGQAASPTTVGKEFRVFAERCKGRARDLAEAPVYGKMNGASGNFNAHCAACPEVDWPQLCETVVGSLGLSCNPCTTQVEPGDGSAALLHALCRFNTVLIDLDRDLWGYISLGYFGQRAAQGEVGSSTMPHKVNPIDFENSEGNAGVANALAAHLAASLPLSRWQRDLSGSTVIRNLGPVFAHSLLAVRSAITGLRKLSLNETALARDLEAHPEVLAEAIQTVMRLHGLDEPYEQLKALTRGRADLSLRDLHGFIETLELPGDHKRRLLQLSPRTYVGLAARLAAAANGK